MYILGISSFYHDSAAVIIKDGKVVVAVEEERFTRIKHDNTFPYEAIDFCLKSSGIRISDIDYVAYYEKPLLKLERILETFVDTYPKSLSPFLKGIPEWLSDKIKVENIIRKKIGFKGKVFFVPHHLSHAAVCFFPSHFKRSAILTIDGVGEWETTVLWFGNGVKIQKLKHIDFPNSLGLLYSTFTSFLGFKVNNDEYKVMGLAAYGKPIYKDEIKSMLHLKEDGSFRLNLDYFSFRETFRMWSKKVEELFGKPRKYGAPITRRDKDLAASLQDVTEEVYFKILNHLYALTKTKNLCLGGGVALNSLANGKIYENTPFKRIYNFGPAGDSGTALGSALNVYYLLTKNKKREKIENLFFGSFYTNEEIEILLKKSQLHYKRYNNENDLLKKTVNVLKNNKIVGWFQGKMEFGPRALGARSILANPRLRKMKSEVNKIKKREKFRPFAGSVLQEKVHLLFNVPEAKHFSPFMNFCFTVKKEKSKNIAAIVHKDGTCRVQTVNSSYGKYYKLIKEFYKLTGIPCVLNTSFNISTEPIVENPDQAIEDFLSTPMDYLVIEDFLVSKG